jgi:hypothetical protein
MAAKSTSKTKARRDTTVAPIVRFTPEQRAAYLEHEVQSVVSRAEQTPTVYEWAGGSEALDRLTEVFYRNHVHDDEILGPVFANMPADHPHHVALWLAEVFGGPTGRVSFPG